MGDPTVFAGNESTEANVEQVENVDSTVVEQTTEETNTWNSDVNEDYTDIASKYESVNDVFKELTNAQHLIGKKGAIKPGEDATDADWDSYYDQIGRPGESSEYVLGEVTEDSPDWVQETDAKFRELAHASGLNQEQAHSLYNQYMESQTVFEQEQIAIAQQQNEDCMKTLKDSYGNDSARMLGLAVDVAKESGIFDLLKASNLANSPQMVSLLADYAQLKGSASSPQLDSTISNSSQSIDEQIADIRSNPAYGTAGKEGRELMAKADKLYIRKSNGIK